MKKMKLSLAILMIQGIYYKRKQENIKFMLSYQIYIIFLRDAGKRRISSDYPKRIVLT